VNFTHLTHGHLQLWVELYFRRERIFEKANLTCLTIAYLECHSHVGNGCIQETNICKNIVITWLCKLILLYMWHRVYKYHLSVSMKRNMKNNQADCLLGPNLRISKDWSFVKKVGLKVIWYSEEMKIIEI